MPKSEMPDPNPEHISTSFVERSDLTLPEVASPLHPVADAYSKKVENLRHAVTLYVAWYNFSRIHSSLRVTPAMEAWLTKHVRGLAELLGAA
jgi:hypothetical protein